MGERLPQSVTYRAVFKAYLSSDGISPATGKTIALVLSKNGAAFGNPSGGATTLTEIALGWYYADFSTTDTGTLGPLIARATEATIDPIERDYTVVVDTPAAIKAKTDNLPASPAAVGSAMTLTSGERDSIADVLLNRDMSVGTDSGSATVRTVRQALRFLRNKWTVAAGTLTVCKEDDSAASWTASVTGTAGADPITTVDPAGP